MGLEHEEIESSSGAYLSKPSLFSPNSNDYVSFLVILVNYFQGDLRKS